MIQKSIQNKKTGEIAILSSTTPGFWLGEINDYSLSELENNPDWVIISQE